MEVTQTAIHPTESAAASAPPELPNFIHVLHHYFPNNSLLQFIVNHRLEDPIFVLMVIACLAIFFHSASRKRAMVPGRLQAFAETLIESLLNVICGILGEKQGRRHFPFLASLFLFILGMNWFGLIPLMKSPTSNIQVTGALAISVFFYVQFTALKGLGVKGYFHHLMGEPKDVIGWALVPLFLPLHVVEEFIKPLSLACRLYGNIFGEDLLLGIALVLGVGMVTAFWPGAFIGFPLHLPFVFLSLLLSTIQALVFTLLATVYVSIVLPHESHEESSESSI